MYHGTFLISCIFYYVLDEEKDERKAG